MIANIRFPQTTFRQQNNECIPASLGTALYPFTNIPVQDFVAVAIRCWFLARGQSGYDQAESILVNCMEPLFTFIRSRMQLERRCGLGGLDTILQNESATAIVALSFSNGRLPHSVCVSHDGISFALRDSAMQASNSNPDGSGVSVAEALAHVPEIREAGHVIVFRAGSTPEPTAPAP
jgi:hypothetical protein